MSSKELFELMADYNVLMNDTICKSLMHLTNDTLWENKNAFFGSIMGTLNHIMVGDLIWLSRFNQHPNYSNGFDALAQLSEFKKPTGLNDTLYKTRKDFTVNRQLLDSMIIEFINEVEVYDLKAVLTYKNTQNECFQRRFDMLLQHLFNHQTHHRGQVTTLLSQMTIDIGSTDLLMLIPELDC